MKNDISPYTCIVENCPTPYRFYVTRNEWRDHVLCDHPPKWRCCCCTGTRPIFQSLPAFIAHLDEKHEGQVSDDTFDRIMAKSTFRTFGITNCPLCNDHGPTDSPELIEHVLGHIYDFSMYALPWRTTAQQDLKKPIRTFNDIAPVLDPNDNKHATEMRISRNTRILEWVNEASSEEETVTPEQMATIRDHDWDDYQAMDDEDRADPVMVDYFDRADVDYFDDDASSRGASSQADYSASTRHLSVSSSRGLSSHSQANSPLSAPKMDSNFAESTIVDDDKSLNDKEGIEPVYNETPTTAPVELLDDEDSTVLFHPARAPDNQETSFEIGLEEIWQPSGHPIVNDPGNRFPRRIISDRQGVIDVRCEVIVAIHGSLNSTSDKAATLLVYDFAFNQMKRSRRVTSAVITLEFASVDPNAPGPGVHAIAPSGRYSLAETTENKHVESSGNANLGVEFEQGVSLGRAQNWTKSVDRKEHDFGTMIGDTIFNAWGEQTGAKFALRENKSKKMGIPSFFRFSILLERSTFDIFNCTFEIDVQAGWKTGMEKRFAGKTQDDSFYYYPGHPPINKLKDWEGRFDKGDLGSIDLDKMYEVTTHTPFQAA